jgi:hypothetical protein
MRIPFLILTLLGSVPLLNADPAPGFIWTGDAVLSPQLQAIDGGLITTPNGFDFTASCDSYVGCGGNFEVDRNFTVSSPGSFVLSTDITAGGSDFNCGIFSCQPYAFLSASYRTSSSICPGVSSVCLGADQLDIAGSGSSASGTTDMSGIGCQDVGSDCAAFLNLSDARSVSVDLGVGDYTLDQMYSVMVSGNGFTEFSASFDTTLIAAPEPRPSTALLAVAFFASLCLRHRAAKARA